MQRQGKSQNMLLLFLEEALQFLEQLPAERVRRGDADEDTRRAALRAIDSAIGALHCAVSVAGRPGALAGASALPAADVGSSLQQNIDMLKRRRNEIAGAVDATAAARQAKRQPPPPPPPSLQQEPAAAVARTSDDEPAKDGVATTPCCSVAWSDVVGNAEAKRLLRQALVLPPKYPHLFCGSRVPWRSILLFGPPGTGKTQLARAAATELGGCSFFAVSAADVMTKWVGGAENTVRALFRAARAAPKAVIFFDEIDALFGRGDSEVARRVTTEFLVQLEGAGTPAAQPLFSEKNEKNNGQVARKDRGRRDAESPDLFDQGAGRGSANAPPAAAAAVAAAPAALSPRHRRDAGGSSRSDTPTPSARRVPQAGPRHDAQSDTPSAAAPARSASHVESQRVPQAGPRHDAQSDTPSAAAPARSASHVGSQRVPQAGPRQDAGSCTRSDTPSVPSAPHVGTRHTSHTQQQSGLHRDPDSPTTPRFNPGQEVSGTEGPESVRRKSDGYDGCAPSAPTEFAGATGRQSTEGEAVRSGAARVQRAGGDRHPARLAKAPGLRNPPAKARRVLRADDDAFFCSPQSNEDLFDDSPCAELGASNRGSTADGQSGAGAAPAATCEVHPPVFEGHANPIAGGALATPQCGLSGAELVSRRGSTADGQSGAGAAPAATCEVHPPVFEGHANPIAGGALATPQCGLSGAELVSRSAFSHSADAPPDEPASAAPRKKPRPAAGKKREWRPRRSPPPANKLFILAATNRPWDLDAAVLRRFEQRVYVPLPDADTRHTMIDSFSSANASTLAESDIEQLTERTEGFSGSDIGQLLRSANMLPVEEYFSRRSSSRSGSEAGDGGGGEEDSSSSDGEPYVPPLEMRHVVKLLAGACPTVRAADVARYEEFHRSGTLGAKRKRQSSQ
ncbi:Vacuolar protein sorting-associated protein 4 [Diplonema papillatum]|nr:Vacuolar protein sorting-associated protein 4 [Diplonema papillatum]